MEIGLHLEPQELASVVEALHDAILRRLSWSVLEVHKGWRELPIRHAQTIIDASVSAYVKGMMMFTSANFDKNPDYRVEFSFPDKVWDTLTEFTQAKSWNDVPFHGTHGDRCPVCRKFNR
jgi:hypothetical protein